MDKDTIAFVRDIAEGLKGVPDAVRHHVSVHDAASNPRHPLFRLVEVTLTLTIGVLNAACDRAEKKLNS